MSQKLPKLRLILPQHCNLSCKVCHQENNLYTFNTNLNKTFDALIKLHHKETIEHITITGGEPLISHNLQDTLSIVNFIRNQLKQCSISINTNGSHLSNELVSLLPTMLDYLKISLYGSNSEEYLSYTNVDAYNCVISNIIDLTDKNIKLGLNILINTCLLNHETIARYLSISKTYGIPIKFIEMTYHHWYIESKKEHYNNLYAPVRNLELLLIEMGAELHHFNFNRKAYEIDGIITEIYRCPNSIIISNGSEYSAGFSHLLRSDGSFIKEQTHFSLQ